MLKHLALKFETKEVSDEGAFEGYASTMSVDRGNDIVAMGAFEKSLAEHKANGTKPKMLFQHDPDRVIGVWDEMRQDDKGLFVKGRIIKGTSLGSDVHALMRAGALDSMSIGYRTVDAEHEKTDGAMVRRIKEAELWEVSVVTFPMQPEARVTSVKHDLTIRDVERILREAGSGNTMAKLIAAHGFNEAKSRLEGQREADEKGRADLMKALQDLSAAAKGF